MIKKDGPQKRTLRVMSLNKVIPNILTLLALASGLTSMRFALKEEWEHATLAIAVAAVLDALDGRVARLLKGASKFGAELDSLSDFVCFGVAPAMILYLWSMQNVGRWGWIACMLFTMACGLRLARFNVASEDTAKPAWAHAFFTGVPAPAGAGIVLLPLILSFLGGDQYFRQPSLVVAWELLAGGLLISTIPTFSFKTNRIPKSWMLPLMLFVAASATFIINKPWWSLTVLIVLYLISIPFSFRRQRILKNRKSSS